MPYTHMDNESVDGKSEPSSLGILEPGGSQAPMGGIQT